MVLLFIAAAAYSYRDTVVDTFFAAPREESGIAGEPASQTDDDEAEENIDEETETADESSDDAKGEPTALPSAKTIVGVPFAAQAPLGDWSDPKQQHGCEEASLIMVWHFLRGEGLSPEAAVAEIVAMSDFETEKYGNYYDTSAADTLRVFKDYYGYEDGRVEYGITADDIKREIAAGRPVVSPMNGVKLMNPHFTQPGPEFHQLVVIGYDDAAREFITNDPGTRHGESYRYDYDLFMSAMRDYKTGADEPVDEIVRAMIVFGKDQGE